MIHKTTLTYDTLEHVWVLTVQTTSKQYIGETRQKAIEACLARLTRDDTIRLTHADV